MCLVTAMSFLLYVLFFEVINSILQQNLLASMFTEGMTCPLEVHGSGTGEALFLFIIYSCYYVSMERLGLVVLS